MESLKNLYDGLMQSINSFLKNTDGDLNLFGKIITILLIFIAIGVIVKVANRIIDRTLTYKSFSKFQISDRRRDTLTNILKKVVKYTLFFIGIVMSLEIFNINTASIIATAGIGGLAIGFGAQSLVKDIITGFFILLEDQYAVGDYVQIDSKEGIVEELGVRVTKIRDFTGELHIIPNSSITVVTNRTRGAMRALEVMERVSGEIAKTNDTIIEGPTVLGVASFGSSDVVIRSIAKTKPMEQWAVEREMRKKYKQAFDREGIEIPYSKVVVYGGGDK
jgi:small conductance mechanosensitive channel